MPQEIPGEEKVTLPDRSPCPAGRGLGQLVVLAWLVWAGPLAAEVVIAADHDKNRTGMKAAEQAAELWASQGRKVSIALPPIPGADFNDMARDGLSATEFAA